MAAVTVWSDFGAEEKTHQSISQFSHSVVSDSLQPPELQHARPPCPSPTLRVHPNSCPLSWWCHNRVISEGLLSLRDHEFNLVTNFAILWVWKFSFRLEIRIVFCCFFFFFLNQILPSSVSLHSFLPLALPFPYPSCLPFILLWDFGYIVRKYTDWVEK